MSTPGPDFRVVHSGTEQGIEWAVCHAPPFAAPALNGYCRVPEGQTDWESEIDVHGGVTYGGTTWIGFDTMHAGDYWPGNSLFERRHNHDIEWTPEMVVKETVRMARQVADISNFSPVHSFVTAANADNDQDAP